MRPIKIILDFFQKKRYEVYDSGLTSVSSVVLSLLITKAIGFNEFGIFAILIIIYLYLNQIISSLTITPLRVFFYSEKVILRVIYLSSTFYFYLILTVASAIFFYKAPISTYNLIGLNQLPENISTFFSLYIVFEAIHSILKQTLTLLRKFYYAFLVNLLTQMLKLSLLIYFLIRGQLTLEYVLLTFIASSLPSIFITSYFLFKNKYLALNPNLSESLSCFIKSANYGIYNLAAVSSLFFSSNYVLILISMQIGSYYVGIIKLIQNIFSVMHPIYALINNIEISSLSSYFNDRYNFHRYAKKIFIQYNVINSILLAALIIPISIFLHYYDNSLYSDFPYLIVGFFVIYLIMPNVYLYNIYLLADQKKALYLTTIILTSLFIFCISGTLVARFSVNSIIISYFIGYAFQLISFFYYRKRSA